jgi:hypothetical protein
MAVIGKADPLLQAIIHFIHCAKHSYHATLFGLNSNNVSCHLLVLIQAQVFVSGISS